MAPHHRNAANNPTLHNSLVCPPPALPSATRKGARRVEDVPSDVLYWLHRGVLSTKNLMEFLALSPDVLLWHLGHPETPTKDYARTSPQSNNPYSKDCWQTLHRAWLTSAHLWQNLSKLKQHQNLAKEIAHLYPPHEPDHAPFWTFMTTHPSDVVRSWACLALGADADHSASIGGIDTLGNPRNRAQNLLNRHKVFAMDEHFGVREFAWMALRKSVIAHPLLFVDLLTPWSKDPNPYIRRFAIEITRPRGVWCPKLPLFQTTPNLGRPLLDNVMQDPDAYVQLSVGNWLNDAGKTQPDWVKEYVAQWYKPSSSHRYDHMIPRRALRRLLS